MKTRHLRLISHEHSDTPITKSNALSPFGPVRAGLTTSPTTSDQRLTELLNSLESVVANLNSKSSTVLDTLEHVTEGVRVALLSTTNEEGGTDTISKEGF